MAANTIYFSGGEIGTNAVITVSKDDYTYTSTISYYFEGASGTIVQKTAANTINWTIPTSLAANIPNAFTGTCVLICTTYNGEDVVGSYSISVPLYINKENYKPTFTYTINDLNTGAAALCGTGRYILRCSRLQVAINASGAGGATITKREVYIYDDDNPTKISVDNSGFLLIRKKLDVVVTDSRGLSTTQTHTFTNNELLPYTTPVLSTFYVSSYAGGYATVHLGGSYSQRNTYSTTNTLTVYLSYGDSGTRVKYNAPVTITGGTSEYKYFTVDYNLPISNYSPDKWVWVEYQDRVAGDFRTTELPRQGLPLFDWDDNDFNFNIHTNFSNTTTFNRDAQFDNNINVKNQIYIQHQAPRIEFNTLNAGGTQTDAVSIYGADNSNLISIYDWGGNGELLAFKKNGRTRIKNTYGDVLGFDSDSSYRGFRPVGDDIINLGSGGNRWAQIYSSHSTISTSDRNAKTEIEPLAATEENLFDKLKPIKFKFIDGDRIHHGLIAQEVETALDDLGLCALDFGGLCYDYVNKEGETKKVYGLRYEEFIPMCIHEIQQLKERVKELETKLGEVEKE